MQRAPWLLPSILVLLAARVASGGGLFVASQNSTSVLEYGSTSGAFERVFAETIAQGFQNPGGIALRPSDGVLHVASQASGEIWRYTTATGALITPALKTGLYGPRGLAFDATGANLFFADPLDDVAETADTREEDRPAGRRAERGGDRRRRAFLRGGGEWRAGLRHRHGRRSRRALPDRRRRGHDGDLERSRRSARHPVPLRDADADRRQRLASRARIHAQRRDLGLHARRAAGVVGRAGALRARARAGRAPQRDGLRLRRRRAGGSDHARGDAPGRAGRRRARRARRTRPGAAARCWSPARTQTR